MYDKNNVFAKIIRREIPASVVYEDDFLIAIEDIRPVAPVHVLVIPKTEHISFNDFVLNSDEVAVARFFKTVRNIADNVLLLADCGYRLVTNHGALANQEIPHFHVHIISGRELGAMADK